MAKYRKKPVVVEAELFDPAVTDCGLWGIEKYEGKRTESVDGTKNVWWAWRMDTANGPIELQPGNVWLVREPDSGDAWPVADHIFELTYEPVEEDSNG